jgi:hypothetical protein
LEAVMAEEQRKLMRDPEELEKDALKDKNPFLSTMYINQIRLTVPT